MPSDGLDVKDGVIARYPIDLPVKLVEQKEDRFVVIEPSPEHRIVEFPLRAVWRLGEDIDIFEKGKEQKGELLLQKYPSDKEAQTAWDYHAKPEGHRWYVAKLNNKYAKSYTDYEAMLGVPVKTIQTILDEIHKSLHDKDYLWIRDEVYWEDDTQELLEAVADITLLITAGEGGDIETSEDETFVRNTVHIVRDLLLTTYYVKSEAQWDFKNKTFKHDKFLITPSTKPCNEEE